jgi:predicted RNA binding protein YcfA (HicA-like mRNA interferase family)
MPNIKNVTLKQLRSFLLHEGCNNTRSKGGHEFWTRSDLLRPICLQSYIDPVPTFIIKQILRALDMETEDFYKILTTL